MVMPFLLVDVYSVLRPREFCNALFSSLLYFAAFWVKLETNAFLTGVFGCWRSPSLSQSTTAYAIVILFGT